MILLLKKALCEQGGGQNQLNTSCILSDHRNVLSLHSGNEINNITWCVWGPSWLIRCEVSVIPHVRRLENIMGPILSCMGALGTQTYGNKNSPIVELWFLVPVDVQWALNTFLSADHILPYYTLFLIARSSRWDLKNCNCYCKNACLIIEITRTL